MLQLYAHPLSSYCWKAIIALRELGLDHELLILDPDHPENGAAFLARWPLGKMPLLVDGEARVAESSVVIEYLDRRAGGARLIPAGEDALQVRFLDRVFDNYVMTPMNVFVVNRIRPDGQPDTWAIEQARGQLEKSYAWLEAEGLSQGDWACGATFTLADCSAAPALFYADKVVPLARRYPRLEAYLGRLLARGSVARTVADAMPYWQMFPFAQAGAMPPG